MQYGLGWCLLIAVVVACDAARPPGIVDPIDSVDSGSADANTPVARDADSPPPDAGEDLCADELRSPVIYYGTREPTALALTPGQVLAIGMWDDGCSGAFVTSEWVITASHCGTRVGDEFCVGTNPSDPNVCFEVDEVFDHETHDMTLAHTGELTTARMPLLEPILVNTATPDDSWIGRIAEAAGYGDQETGRSGEREFTAEPIDGFEDDNIVINGEGERGACFGDSGGPLMVLAMDGTIRIAGVLSWGDGDCLGRDRYTRTDLAIDWIELHVGPIDPGEGGCGVETETGRCVGSMAVWCEDDELQVDDCDDDCGFDAASDGYRCISGTDPCEGVGTAGACDGRVIRRCVEGRIQEFDCSVCEQICVEDLSLGAHCAVDPCEGIDYFGRCEGNVAVWCEDGELRSRDCSVRGRTCGYVDDETGYYCQ